MDRKILAIVGLSIILLGFVTFSGCIGGEKPTEGKKTTPAPTQTIPTRGEYFFNESNNKHSYTVQINDRIHVSLAENPTTGYSWNLTMSDGLALNADKYMPSDTSGKVVGAGGIHVWNISAVANGTQRITGIYKRPWEPVFGNETTFELTIVVGEGTCGEQTCPVIIPSQVPPLFNVYIESNNGMVVQEKLHSTINIRLNENPTTGFAWNLSTTNGLIVTKDEYLPADTSGHLVGSGGVRSWYITAEQVGEQKITAIYKRPWEPTMGNETTFNMTIVVT